jgi:hypothetical protein
MICSTGGWTTHKNPVARTNKSMQHQQNITKQKGMIGTSGNSPVNLQNLYKI